MSKIVIVVVVLTMVKETRPPELAEPGAAGRQSARLSFEPFRNRTFAVVAVATAAFAMSNAGIVQTLLPVHAVDALAYDEAVVGFLISITSAAGFLFAFPNGMIADRFGRKWSLGPGLLMMGAAAVTLTVGDVYTTLLVAAVFLGLGEAMGMGTSQTFRDGPRAAGEARDVHGALHDGELGGRDCRAAAACRAVLLRRTRTCRSSR